MNDITLREYEAKAYSTAVYPDKGRNFIYPALGLCGESGEVAEKIKKQIRDHGGTLDPDFAAKVVLELGDVLWYVSALAVEIGSSLTEVATANLNKLNSRKDRDVLHGEGDNR